MWKGNQIQEQLQRRMKMLDDVFHNTIIALERLEVYREQKRVASYRLKATAMSSDRDLHDDKANPPTENNFYLEMQTQCLALFYQTKFDKGDKTFDEVVKYFLNDLLTWYGGREEAHIPPNEVEKYFIPIMAAVSRQVESAPDISKIIKDYVIDIDTDMTTLSDAEKEKVVTEGFIAYTRSMGIVGRKHEEFMQQHGQTDQPFAFSVHRRGSSEAGLRRLLTYFTHEFDKKAPVINLKKLVIKYAPELCDVMNESSSSGSVIESSAPKLRVGMFIELPVTEEIGKIARIDGDTCYCEDPNREEIRSFRIQEYPHIKVYESGQIGIKSRWVLKSE